MAHPLHTAIGKELKKLQKSHRMIAILSKDCSGNIDIPLFIKKPKSNSTEICNADAIVIKNRKIKIIIEIEESNNKPTHICGKYLTANLAEYWAHDTLRKDIDLDKDTVAFLQIIDKKGFSDKSSKPKQFINLKKAINDLITTARKNRFELGCIKSYEILEINGTKIDLTDFIDFIKNNLV
jgi:hypothetical protein